MTTVTWAFVIVAALCRESLCTQYDPNAPNSYVSTTDREIATWAAAAVDKYCGDGGFVGEVKASRDDLVGEIGGENIIVNGLMRFGEHKGGEVDQDFGTIITEEVLQPWVFFKLAPMLFAVLTAIIWLFCCWSACCPCCRCCKRAHKHSIHIKACQVVVITICFLAAMLCILATNVGYGRLANGFDNMLCSGAKLLNVTLEGEAGSDGFIGVIPVLDKFHNLEMQLNEGSPLMNELGTILNSTADIEDALRLTSDSLKLLGEMLSEPGNVRPRTNGTNESLYHVCLACETLGPLVTEIATGVEEGVGNALFKARAEVKSQLEGNRRSDLQQMLQQASGPIVDFKDQMSSALEPLVDPESDMDIVKGHIESLVYQSIFLVHLGALALICGGCCAAGCFAKSSYDPDGFEEPGKCTKRCSCTVWCCSFLFLFMVFLSSGILNLVLIPTSGLCVMLADLDAQLIQDVAAGLDLQLTGDQGEMFEGMVDACWAGKATSSDNLLDIIYTRDNHTGNNTGNKTYLRERMVGMVATPVDAAFAAINQALNGSITIGSNPVFAQLTRSLSNASMMATMLPEPPYYGLTNDTNYSALALDAELIEAAFMTSTQCDAFELAGLGRLNGISDFVTEMQGRYGAVEPVAAHSCIKKVLNCTNATDPQRTQACMAGNNFLDLKRQLLDEKVFRCDLFDVGGSFCDPLSMTRAPSGTWVNDCLRRHSDGYRYTRAEEKYCDLAEFSQYVQDFGARLSLAIDRLDNATVVTLDAISTDLRALIHRYFVGEITEVANGVTCGFMPGIVKQVIDGMCFQGVDGLKVTANMYQISALLIMILAIDMYILWRIAADNITKYRERSSE